MNVARRLASPPQPLLSSAALLMALALPGQHPADAAATKPPATLAVVTTPALPQAISSFGACRSGASLYVYGGHIGREHAHSRANVVGAFHRLDLEGAANWVELPAGPALQGTALVAAADGSLYRVGGLTARNAEGEAANLHSTASVARFVPATGRWEDATPLPEARSSHDALVIGDHLYVAGGWRLTGSSDGEWLRTVWVADLRQQPLVWTAAPGLDHDRRAGAAAALAGRFVLLGGMDDQGTLSSGVVYDPVTARWNATPDLPGLAFGTAAIGRDGQVFATVADGRLLAWNDTATAWQPVAQLEIPRFFHRLVAIDDQTLLALGGAGQGGHTRSVERIALTAPRTPFCQEIVIPAPGAIAQRQALLASGNQLWAVGGNRGKQGDRFGADQFAAEIWHIDLLAQTASLVGQLPRGTQSMAALSWGGHRNHLLVGGLGPVASGDPNPVQTQRAVYRFDGKRASLSPCADLPAPKTQGQLVQHGGKAWLLGGTDFVPDDEGGRTQGDSAEVLVADLTAAHPTFAVAPLRLPRERRSFAAAVLGDSLVLVGGLGDGFASAGPCDVYDFRSGSWSELEAPRPWVSARAAVIGERIYVGCGGTMEGQRFTEDRSLWSWSTGEGWRCVVEALPFAVRNVQMLALRNRLLFYGTDPARAGAIVIRTFEPDRAVLVPVSAMQH